MIEVSALLNVVVEAVCGWLLYRKKQVKGHGTIEANVVEEAAVPWTSEGEGALL